MICIYLSLNWGKFDKQLILVLEINTNQVARLGKTHEFKIQTQNTLRKAKLQMYLKYICRPRI